MKKILNMGRTVCAALFVLVLAGTVVLFATGALSVERIKSAFAPKAAEETAAPGAAAATPDMDEVSRKIMAQSRLLDEKRVNEPVTASANETALYALKSQVETRRAALDKDLVAFQTERAAFDKSKKEFETKVADEGFKKNLEILQAMEPKEAARTIYAWKDEDILRYFRLMKATALKDIIAELNKYPAKSTEGQRGAELLNRLDEFTFDTSGATAGS